MKTSLFVLIAGLILIACNPSSKNNETDNNADIDKLVPLDVKMESPRSGDWLDVHKEPGQSFEQYKKAKPVSPSTTLTKIYLQPIGKFTPAEQKLLMYTAEYLHIFFDMETPILPVLSDSFIPAIARRGTQDGEQFQTGYILDYLQINIPRDGIVIMAITPTDLYPSDNYNFVFGQARTKQRVAVSSFNRFQDEPLDTVNYSLCLNRLIKTSSHEISHMFTCLHCTHAVCLMNGSNSLWESDSRPNRLCSDCLRKLEWNLGFDVRKRNAALNDFFQRHKMNEDHALATADLQALD